MKTQLVSGIAAAMLLTLAVAPAWAVTISGKVRLADGTPVNAVLLRVMTKTEGLPGSPLTDNTGFYTVTVDSGFSGTVTPTDVNYVFEPEGRSYSSITSDQADQDYVASPRAFWISGYVRTAAGTGITGVVIGGWLVTTTNADGYYLINNVPHGWSGTLTPAKSGYTFDPPNRTYANVTQVTGPDNYVGTPVPPGDGTSDGTSNQGDSSSDSTNGSGDGTNDGTGGGNNGSSDNGTSGSGDTGTSDTSGGNGTSDTSGGTGDDTSGTGGAEVNPPAACGAGACGAGITSWLPLSILGWCGLKLSFGLRRPGRR